jgi:PAS domain-containing protein
MDRAPSRLDPRARPLADTWLLTLFAALLALGLPRVVSGLQVDFVACALGLLALAILHVGFTLLAVRAPAASRTGTRLLVALHLSCVVILAFIWRRSGGLQNPAFLAVFTLPVVGAVFISRWQSYATAALAVAAVAVMAAAQMPAGPRWASSIGTMAGATGRPFAAFYAPAAYYSVALQVFAVAAFACAIAAEYLRTLHDRLNLQVAAARGEALRNERLWSALVEELPFAAALIDVETREILGASALAVAGWGAKEGRIEGRQLFEVVRFSYPEAIEALIGGDDGVEPLSIARLGGELRATEVRVRHIARDGRRMALVAISDTTEILCLRAALDAAEHASFVVDTSGRVLLLNRPARAVFPEVNVGSELAKLVPDAAAWWDAGISRCRKMHLTVSRRTYRVTATAVALPGEEERLHVIAFVPAAPLAGADRAATSLSAAMGQP